MNCLFSEDDNPRIVPANAFHARNVQFLDEEFNFAPGEGRGELSKKG